MERSNAEEENMFCTTHTLKFPDFGELDFATLVQSLYFKVRFLKHVIQSCIFLHLNISK